MNLLDDCEIEKNIGNNIFIIIKENKYNKNISYYNINYKNILNNLYQEGTFVYKNEMINTIINYLLMNDEELSIHTGYTTPQRYRENIINSLRFFIETEIKVFNNLDNQDNIIYEIIKINFNKKQTKNFNLILNNINFNIDIIIEQKNYNNNSYFYISYKINNSDKNLIINLKNIFKNNILDGDIVYKNDMTTIIINYLLMDDDKLNKLIGNSTIQQYRINLMKTLNLFWD